MSSAAHATVTVPATTANIGPGFDCLGAALSLYNQFRFRPVASADSNPAPFIQVTGPESEKLACTTDNLVYRAFQTVYQRLNQPVPAVHIEIDLGIPLTRGLGSSATAIVGGLLGANALAGQPLSSSELVQLAIALEGHPDNVVPAVLGGCQLSIAQDTPTDQQWAICEIPWHEEIVPVVAVPDFELSTEAARGVMPQTYSRADAIFNVGHLGLLLRGLQTGNRQWLQTALHDKIHQPYRQSLISGYEGVKQAAISAGAHGVVISGAGPSLLALASPQTQAAVTTAMSAAWHQCNIQAQAMVLPLDTAGATCAVDRR